MLQPLVGVRQNSEGRNGAYLIESEHLAGHLAAIDESNAHPEIDLRDTVSIVTGGASLANSVYSRGVRT